jgi:hypothetical protein
MIAGLFVAYGAQEHAEPKTVAEVLGGIITGSTHRLSASARVLAKHFVTYLNAELLPAFDALPTDLDFLSTKDKTAVLDGLAKTNSAGKWLAHLLESSTAHQVQSSLAVLVRRLAPELGSVIVKSPATPNVEFKKNVRKHFKTDFVVFTTDTSLLGGILIYRNGMLTDASWLGKIKSLETLQTTK